MKRLNDMIVLACQCMLSITAFMFAVFILLKFAMLLFSWL